MIQSSYKKIHKKIILIVSSLFLSFVNFTFSVSSNDEKITIIYPKYNQYVNPQNGFCLTLGKLSDPTIKLKINFEDVEVQSNGTFLYYAKLIYPVLNDSTYNLLGDTLDGFLIYLLKKGETLDTFILPVKFRKPLRTSSQDILTIDKNYPIQPGEDLELNPGEMLKISFKGTPNCQGYFTIEGVNRKFPLVETFLTNQFFLSEAVFGDGFKLSQDTIRGIYEGHLIVPKENWLNKSITIHLIHDKLGKKEFQLNSKITVKKDTFYKVVQILYDPNLVIGRTGPMLGYKLFLPEGVKLVSDGYRNGFYRIRLSENNHVFVPGNSVKHLPLGTPPPKSTLELIRTKDEKGFVKVEFGLHEKLPYEVIQSIDPNQLKVRIYNCISNIDWIFYDPAQDIINDITWQQIDDDVLEVNITLKQKQQWGYIIEYNGTILTLKIKKTPEIEKTFLFFGNPLKNKVIVLDPGHNPDDGAVGPSGLKEKEINLNLALLIKEELEKSGATVYLTRFDEPLPLRQRKIKVLSFNSDISISIHNNAVPDGVNPLKHNGLSVYFYYPQAKKLAFKIHEKLVKNLQLPDFGIYWDNLYMCRIHETIALLIEPAFIIHPEQEELLKQDQFQRKIAKSVRDALIEFFEEVQE